MAEISIIIPVYNVETYLKRCINSIREQTFSNFDVILVDDGSPDQCPSICDEYVQIDTRIYVIHQKNRGPSAARNVGIEWAFENSDSKFLAFIDSDDWVHPQYLECLLRMVKEYKVKVGACSFHSTNRYVILTEGEKKRERCMSPEDFYDMNRVNATVVWGKLYCKNCFRTIRFPEGKLHEDEFTTYKILFELPYLIVSEKKLYYYFENENSIMHKTWTESRLDALEAHKEQILFFSEKGFPKAYFRTIRAYVGAICNSCEKLKKENIKFEQRKELQKDLRQALKIYKQQVPFNECRWAYVVAYPKFTRFYSFVERLIKGIWRRIHG